LAAISLWEAQMLHQKGRLVLEMDFPVWLSQASGWENAERLKG
jgi:PIN domain nuclease of toxin-antitoxin system